MASKKAAPKKSPPQKPPSKAEGVKSLWGAARPAEELESMMKAKVFITGPSGAGKSSLAARTGRVLYVPTELQGIPVVRDNNPAALIWHNSIDHHPPRPGVRNYQDFERLRAMLQDPELPERVDWVVIDGITDLQTILRAHYTKKQGKRQDITDMDSWGLTIDMTAKIAREFRDLPVHVIVTALDQEVEINGRIVHRPALNGKRLPNQMAQYFNLVGYAYKNELESGEMRWQVMFNGNERYLTKAAPGIDDIEPPEPLCWVAKRFGGGMPLDVADRVAAWRAMESAEEKKGDEDDDEVDSNPFA